MRIQIHKRGVIVYGISLILSLAFASFYGGPVSYAWLYGVICLIPLSILYTILNYKFLNIFQEIEVHKVTKGEEHTYRVLFENEGLFPIHKMTIKSLKDRCVLHDICDGQEISLDAHEKKELISQISCKYAGAYDVGIEKIALSDPFNIYTVELKVIYNFRAVVKPKITDVAGQVLDMENIVNSLGFKSDRLYEDTPGSDLRNYQIGDSLKSINWKVSAKHNELMVRNPEPLEKRRVTILIEARRDAEEKGDIEYLKTRDKFLEFIVSAAWHFGQQDVPVKLIYPSGGIKEFTVDSRESFMEFYGIVADGIYYGSKNVFNEVTKIATERRSRSYENDTWIIITEAPGQGENSVIVCD